MSLVATAAVLLAGVWLLLSGDAREYHAFGAVLVALGVAGLVLHALIFARVRRGAAAGRSGQAVRTPR